MEYVHADVFSVTPYGGNSLAVFPSAGELEPRQMLAITRELRHFESVFLEPTSAHNEVRARVFDLFEELAFAGHPLIGAGAVLHQAMGSSTEQTWRMVLPAKTVTLETHKTESGYFGLLDQGQPEFLGVVSERERFAHAFSLQLDDLEPALPLEVVSTGLRYLVIPVRRGALERAAIEHDITSALHEVNAQFAVLLDETAAEIRHWNNDGIIEDVATGSAAGTVGAYRLRYGLARPDESFVLRQGRFATRPSTLRVQPLGTPQHIRSVRVGGDVAIVGRGVLEVLPT
jgi:trans-2,3-dihydro-3-hydroxyanthranilate isomerase